MIGFVHSTSDALRGRSPRSDGGRFAENIALRFLRRHGCVVLERNYRARSGTGEIDVVACQGAALVFVEVKMLTAAEYGAPDCAAASANRPGLAEAAREYVHRSGAGWIKKRFDIVSVVLGNPMRVDWRRDTIR